MGGRASCSRDFAQTVNGAALRRLLISTVAKQNLYNQLKYTSYARLWHCNLESSGELRIWVRYSESKYLVQ